MNETIATLGATEQANGEAFSLGWWNTVGRKLLVTLPTLDGTETNADEPGGMPAPLTWDVFLQSVRESQERALLINASPDGSTLHAFTRLPSLGWHYQALTADVLVEWATAVVLARDNPELLRPLH